MVIFVAKGSKKKTEELTGVTKCYVFCGEQSFLKMNWKIKPLHFYFSLFCSHLYGSKEIENFCGRDEAKKKIIVRKPVVKNASNSEIF